MYISCCYKVVVGGVGVHRVEVATMAWAVYEVVYEVVEAEVEQHDSTGQQVLLDA
tara:strand:- start:34 stop:198 length:165 start_codon:yes stop_codon:yes gene_type:complete